MTAGILVSTALAVTYFASGQTASHPVYTKPEVCAGCHQSIWETYRKTGMARSFYRPSVANQVEDYSANDTYYHQASDSYFTMLQRDGDYYQRRYQKDSTGKTINVMEKRIDLIIGSGNHSRAYLHRASSGKLVELPLAWYSEKGGYLAMNPGYDRPDHEGFRREISYDCMFCHNAYPETPAGHDQPFAEPVYPVALPEGIDCQRCHGPGSKHAQVAGMNGASKEQIRSSILNPARLSQDRQMEVCMQCHLETTSFPLPNSIQRYERGAFSYKPGEPLADFILNFDHAGHDEKFEIVNSAYRLRRSACFLQSKGQLNCTTCHNPHDVPRGTEAARHYTAVCRQCHAGSFNQLVTTGKHTGADNCTNCHMPKRRTEDVVHVVMTDHYIQRRKPGGDLLIDLAERHETDGNTYRGRVVPYYPSPLPHTPENDLYLAVAQVVQGSNLKEGLPQLSAAIARYHPARYEYYLELAEAWRMDGQPSRAIPLYREAARKNPNSVYALQKLGTALRRAGQSAEAEDVLKRASILAPENAVTWRELGLTYQAQGKQPDAIAALQKAIALNPDMSEAHNNLGAIWSALNQPARAAEAFREAIRITPDYADAHVNLGNLLSEAGDLPQARYHLETALRLNPKDATVHYDYAMVLGRMREADPAERELEVALMTDPNFADAHMLLGDLLMAKEKPQAALSHYREAVRIQPESGRAHLSLGIAFATTGYIEDAVTHLRKAASDSDTSIRSEAAQMLKQLGK